MIILNNLSINELKLLYEEYSLESKYWKNGIDDDNLNYNFLLKEISELIEEKRLQIINDLLK
jgi:hypothetical protein